MKEVEFDKRSEYEINNTKYIVSAVFDDEKETLMTKILKLTSSECDEMIFTE